MVNLRSFTVSDELFLGFEVLVDLDQVDDLMDIVNIVYNKLINALGSMSILVEKLKTRNFHIHDLTFEQLLVSDHRALFYVCSQCSGLSQNEVDF
jgi:hypothetical protein